MLKGVRSGLELFKFEQRTLKKNRLKLIFNRVDLPLSFLIFLGVEKISRNFDATSRFKGDSWSFRRKGLFVDSVKDFVHSRLRVVSTNYRQTIPDGLWRERRVKTPLSLFIPGTFGRTKFTSSNSGHRPFCTFFLFMVKGDFLSLSLQKKTTWTKSINGEADR